MRTCTLGLLATSSIAHAAAQKVVKLDTRATHPQHVKQIKRAAKADSAYLFNDVNNGLYSIEVQIGTPGQPFTLQLDTGSTDVWVNSQSSQYCQQGNCDDYYSSQNSSTYKLSVQGAFNVSYGDGTGAAGNLFTDILSVAGIQLTNQTMGLATTSDIPYGLMGVGMVGTEGSCNAEPPYCYPNVLDTMVTEGKINSHAFSLYLNDISQSTGNILFGGVDSSRYTGDLVAIPMVGIPLEDGSEETDRYTVAWTNFTITTPNGVEQFLTQPVSVPALLDSGTTLCQLPSPIVDIIWQQMGAVEVEGFGFAPCYLRTANATIDFHVGGSNGAVMSIPLREFLLNVDSETASLWHKLGGTDYCQIGVQKNDELPIFGDTILRTAYIVYDLDNRVVALAKANFNPTGAANIQEITNGTSSNIPGVARTASSVSSLSSLATASQGPIRSTGGGVGTATAGLTTASIVPLASFTTAKYTGQDGYTAMSSITTSAPSSTGGSSGSSSSKGAASAVTVPRMGFEGVAVAGLVSAFMAIGVGMVLL